jgi:primosomal protein N'
MHVVTVIPIMRGTTLDELTYFTVREMQPGDVVSVPIRGSEQPALVIHIEEAQNLKSSIRTQNFELQKIGSAAPLPLCTPQFMAMCAATARIHAATIGATLHSLVPSVVIDERPLTFRQPVHTPHTFQQFAIQDTFENRLAIYKNIARECIAKQESLLIIAPQRTIAEQLHEALSHGIERHVRLFHGGMARKKVTAFWEEQNARTEATILIGTPLALGTPLARLYTIIVEQESDDSYTLFERPHIDVRVAATEYARALGARVMLADTMLRIGTYAECERAARDQYTPSLYKVRGTATTTLVHKEKTERGHVLSQELFQIMSDMIDRKKKILVLVARKGIATAVYCTDCGDRMLCPRCKGQYRLTKAGPEEQPVLSCPRCGHSESSHVTCRTCNSWKLKNYGFPLDAVTHIVQETFKQVRVTSLDADTAREHDIRKVVGRLHDSLDPEIIVSTNVIIPYHARFDETISFRAGEGDTGGESRFTGIDSKSGFADGGTRCGEYRLAERPIQCRAIDTAAEYQRRCA